MNPLQFITESNRIEGILRPPTKAELKEFYRFADLDDVTVEDMERFVSVYQPNARLRDKMGLDVRVGRHQPPRGGPEIRKSLEMILDIASRGSDPFLTHIDYETLHPFTDGNGRSGRMLWAWQMNEVPDIGFLHLFYYQALAARASSVRERNENQPVAPGSPKSFFMKRGISMSQAEAEAHQHFWIPRAASGPRSVPRQMNLLGNSTT